MMNTYTVYGRVVTPNEVIDNGAVAVENGRIVYSGAAVTAPLCGEKVNCSGLAVMPGFVDIHCHAGDETWFYENPAECAEYHLGHGTTTMCGTLYRDLGFDGIMSGLLKIRKAMPGCPNLCGAHLEGPYLNPNYGSKSTGEKTVVQRTDYMPLLKTGVVRYVTLAPEVDGLYQFLTDLVRMDIPVAMGHSEASPSDVKRFADGGATAVTHLFDATGASISPTRWGGTIETDFNAAALVRNDLYYELICDSMGVHVRRELVMLVKKTVGCGKMVAITDACGGPGDGSDVNFIDGELMGSKLTMDRVAANLSALGFTLPEIAELTSSNPARVIRRFGSVGSLEVGKRADIAILDDSFKPVRIFKS